MQGTSSGPKVKGTITGVDYLRVRADGPIPGVLVRLGPFASTVAAIRVAGADGELPSQATLAGDAAWALCQLDVAPEPTTVTANPR